MAREKERNAMKSGYLMRGMCAVAFAALVFHSTAAAQPPATSYLAEAAKYPDAATKPTPRGADGHPDLNGVWHHYFGGIVQQVDGNFVLGGIGGPPKAGAPRPQPDPKPDYKPELVAKVQALSKNQVNEDPTLHCKPPGVPRIGPPQQIVHTPKQAVFLYSDITGSQWRAVPLDGRAHSNDPETEGTYNGDSVGHWDGDTLVVDVTRLSDETWLGDNGLFHSDKLHVIERFRRVGDTIQYQMTAMDPEVLQKPWTITRTLTLQRDQLEEAPPCVDRDAGHYVNLEHHDNGR
jgi:hypothetical protein